MMIYDERIEINMSEFYKQIGDTLKRNYPNTTAWILTGNIEAIKHVGLRPSRNIDTINGDIPSKLLRYDI
jgi:hypothetical protein